jgi:hypothetical protein
MGEYRAYLLKEDGHAIHRLDLLCPDDEAATGVKRTTRAHVSGGVRFFAGPRDRRLPREFSGLIGREPRL